MLKLARNNAEAHLFIDLRPCSCGEHRFARHSAVAMVNGDLASRYTGACARCGAERKFEFRLPQEIMAPPATGVQFGGAKSSELLDPGEWLLVADRCARSVPVSQTGLEGEARRSARHTLATAVAALEEVLKFIPPGAAEVPVSAFTTLLGRETRMLEPGRFRAVRLDAVRQAYADASARLEGVRQADTDAGVRIEATRQADADANVRPVTKNLLDTGTWQYDYGCVGWEFQLPVPPEIAEHALRLFALLPGFATAAAAAWVTESNGEDAVVIPRGSALDADAIAAPFRDHADIIELDFDLDLQLIAPDGVTEVTLPDGAGLVVGHDDVGPFVRLDLNADIYARRTWGRNRDNQRLAELNQPRLAAFLAQLHEMGRFTALYNEDYRAQMTERGFS